jgi:hypothetical protein
VDHPIDVVRFGREHLPIDVRLPVRREHERDLLERKAPTAPERDQRQPLEYAGIELTAQSAPSSGGDQPFLLVKP